MQAGEQPGECFNSRFDIRGDFSSRLTARSKTIGMVSIKKSRIGVTIGIMVSTVREIVSRICGMRLITQSKIFDRYGIKSVTMLVFIAVNVCEILLNWSFMAAPALTVSLSTTRPRA